MTGLSLFAPVLWATVQAGPTLNIEEALRIAEANAFQVRISRSELEQTRQRVNEARGRLGPRVDVDNVYTRYDRELRSEGQVFRPIDQAQTQISVRMPLDITGNLKKGVRASEAAIEVAQQNLNADRNDLRFNVRAAYFDVLQAQAQVKVFEETLDSARKRLANTELEFREGARARVDVLRFQTQVQQAESDLISARNAELLAKHAFNNAIGRPIETPVTLEGTPTMPSVEIDEEGMTKTAFANRPELKAFAANQKVLELVRLSEEGGMLPSLNVAAIHSRDWKTSSGTSNQKTTFGQISLSIPAFDSGVTRARVKAARQDEEQNRIRTEQTQLGISLEVRQALTNLVNAKARWDSAQKQVEFAAETFRLANIRFEAGEGILLEVTDAQAELTAARTQLVTATYDYLTTYAQLQRALGTDLPPSTPATKLEKQN